MDTHLLYKYFNGQASEDEAKKIIAWLDEDVKHRKEFIKLKKTWIESGIGLSNDHSQTDDSYTEFLNNIEDKGAQQPTKTRNLRIVPFWRYAAIIVLLLGFAFTGYLVGTRQDILSHVQYYEIEVPYGGKSIITLPDGTKVWLNAGSKLKYEKDFGKDTRKVRLEGEGYFSVTKHHHPFIVHTSHLNISVLGTVFNVKSYPEENEISTTLIEGKVRIDAENSQMEPVYLTQNQKLTFYKNKLSSEITPTGKLENKLGENRSNDLKLLKAMEAFKVERHADIEKSVSWKTGKLVFKGETLESLSVILKRKYDVNFVFNSQELKNYTYSGTLKDYTLEQVLNALKLTSPVNYSIQEKTVYLYVDEDNKNKYEKITK